MSEPQPSQNNPDNKFQTEQVLTIVGGHFIHDVYTAFFAPLLPLIIEKLSLSLTLAGSLTAFMQLPSLLNPFIGYLADRLNLRYFVIFAPAVTATLMSSLGLAPDYFSLAGLLLVTGISIASFHAPAPAMVAKISGNQIGKGMSFFMAGGELGRTLGPILAVWAVSLWGLDGIFSLAILGWLTSGVLYIRFKSIPAEAPKQTRFRSILPGARKLFIPLLFIILSRSFITTSIGVFLPTLMSSQGSTLTRAGGALAVYELAGVIGALASGTLSDRWGRKLVLYIGLSLSSVLMLLFTQVSGWLLMPILFFLGFVSLSPQPVLLALVQDHLPNHRAIANGTYLALSFITRPLATVAIGFIGDTTSLQNAFVWSAIIGIIALPFIYWLPKIKNQQPVMA